MVTVQQFDAWKQSKYAFDDLILQTTVVALVFVSIPKHLVKTLC